MGHVDQLQEQHIYLFHKLDVTPVTGYPEFLERAEVSLLVVGGSRQVGEKEGLYVTVIKKRSPKQLSVDCRPTIARQTLLKICNGYVTVAKKMDLTSPVFKK